MEHIEMIMLKDYLSIVGKRCTNHPLTREKLLNPKDDILETLLDNFISLTSKRADEIYYERHGTERPDYYEEDELVHSNEERELYGEMIECACMMMLLNPTKEREVIINSVMNSDIDSMCTSFKMKTSFAYMIFREYINYIINSYYKVMSLKDRTTLERKYPWLKKIKSSKGYTTLNEKARDVLTELIDMLIDSNVTIDRVFIAMDEYLKESKSDYLIRRHAPEFGSDKKSIRLFKSHQVRMILADVYLSLKTAELLDDEESPIVRFIEETTERDEIRLPDDPNMRYEIYNQFYLHTLDEEFRHLEHCTLTGNDCIGPVQKLNPCYFLD